MEVVLQEAAGVPPTGILSIKVGDTRRQAPVSRIGQPFRFAASPASPLPVLVELLVPAAPPQKLILDPSHDSHVISFGDNMSVVLKLQEAARTQKPQVDSRRSCAAGPSPRRSCEA
jgi:hypothetical protein